MPAFYQKADAALEEGSVKKLADDVGNTIAQEIRDRFAAAHALKKDADKSTEDGRKYVAAYVDYFHLSRRCITSLKPNIITTINRPLREPQVKLNTWCASNAHTLYRVAGKRPRFRGLTR